MSAGNGVGKIFDEHDLGPVSDRLFLGSPVLTTAGAAIPTTLILNGWFENVSALSTAHTAYKNKDQPR